MSAQKQEIYRNTFKEIEAVLDGERNTVARMATISCLLAQAFEHFYWTGFYVVDPDKPTELVVGPYQGTLGCLRIPFGKGVCGTTAQSKQIQIVEDVHAIPNHISCDSKSQSEVVVPVFDSNQKLIAVLDIDSDQLAMFDEIDALALEQICSLVANLN